nr:cytochrome P450 [Pharsalia antennata]
MAFYLGSFLLDLLGLLTALVAVGYVFLLWSFQYWKRRNVPYFEPGIPWGTGGNPFKRNKLTIGEMFSDLYKRSKQNGWKYCGLFFFHNVRLLLVDLDLIKQIMAKDFHNFVDRGMFTNEKDDPLSCHLFAIGGVKWKNLRAKLSPTFTSGKMKTMFSTLADCGLVLEKYVEEHIDNDTGIDMRDVLGKFSTDIIGSCAFGLNCNSFKDPDSPFMENGRKIFRPRPIDFLKFAFSENFPNLCKKLGMTVVPKEAGAFFRKVVEDTITYRQKNNCTRNDFLQLLIEIMNDDVTKEEGLKGDGRTLTMDEAAAQCLVFFVAGFETSSTAMTFAIYEMAQYQDIQDKVRAEIKAVLAKHDDKITYDSLNELKYLKQVIDETLRMYPPVPLVTRESAGDYKIPGEEVIIEKGTKVMVPIQGIHMDEELYENPLQFDPDRFTEENKKRRHPYAHIPFGEGPRICIGERFGIMQIKVGLTSILRKFRVTLNKKTEVPLKLSTRSFFPTAEKGIWVNLEKL